MMLRSDMLVICRLAVRVWLEDEPLAERFGFTTAASKAGGSVCPKAAQTAIKVIR